MPVPVSLKSQVGEQGLADVRLGKKSVRVQFKESGMVFEVPLEHWEEGRPQGTYNITLSRDNQKFVGIKPPQGSYIFQYHSMGGVTNGVPEPQIQRGGPRKSKDGKKSWFQADSLVWRVNLEVMSEGQYEGLRVMYSVPYIFSAIPGSVYTQLQGNSKNELERTETFLRCAGFDLASNDIPFSTNVLPWLDKALQENPAQFLGTINEKGFVGEFSQLPHGLNPTKKKAKRGKK